MLSQDDDATSPWLTLVGNKQTKENDAKVSLYIDFYNIIKTCAPSQLTAQPIQLMWFKSYTIWLFQPMEDLEHSELKGDFVKVSK